MYKPYYRLFLKEVARKRVEDDFPVDIPKPVLGVMPYEHLEPQPVVFPMTYTYPERYVNDSDRLENQIKSSVYGASTVTSY